MVFNSLEMCFLSFVYALKYLLQLKVHLLVLPKIKQANALELRIMISGKKTSSSGKRLSENGISKPTCWPLVTDVRILAVPKS